VAASVPDDQLPSCVDEAMTVQVPVNQCAGIIIYLLTITGTALLATKLSSVVAEQTIVLALPHLDNRLPKLSLIDQRRLDAMFAVPPILGEATMRVAVLEAQATSANNLAAQLDLAEGEDPLETAASTLVTADAWLSTIPDERSRVRITYSRVTAADLSAGDIFNRSNRRGELGP
jgi:hypothetical protein